jgi:diguanylate cyclase (GGDEF)-like protein
MAPSNSSLLPLAAAAGVAPAIVAAAVAPGVGTIVAAVGASLAVTGLVVSNLRRARALATAEQREQQMQTAASASEARIASLVAKLRDASAQDDVTGTLNRRTFLTRLEEVLQRDARLQKPLAFLLVDVDGFRKINAEAGRLVGDDVLVCVARAIRASTRGTDIIGRIGGDEFAVVLGECVDPSPAIDRIFVSLYGERTGGETPLPIRVSIGVVTIPDPQLGVDTVHLFRLVEEALDSVRGGGGSGSRSGRREYRVALTPA